MFKKIGVVGDKDSVLAFKALGIDVFPVVEHDEARKTIDNLAKNDYAVIFVTEQVAQEADEDREQRQHDEHLLTIIFGIDLRVGVVEEGGQIVGAELHRR